MVSRLATPAASMSAVRTTLTGSMMPALTRSSNSPVVRVSAQRWGQIFLLVPLIWSGLILLVHLDPMVDLVELAELVELYWTSG